MGAFGDAVTAVIKRPFTVIYMSIVMLILCVLQRINPLFPLLTGFARAGDADFLEQVISVLKFLIQGDVLPYLLPGVIIISLVAGFFSSLFLSGYFHILNSPVSKASSNSAKAFFRGTRFLFFKSLVIFTVSIASFFIFIIFMLIASVPLMIMLRAVSVEKPQMLLISVLVLVLTAAVLFLGSMYFRIYILFWYPAAVNGHKRPFRAGKRVADKHFWKLVFSFFMFDMAFVSAMFLFTYFEDNIYQFTARWVFYTLFTVLFSSFVFSAYKKGRGHA